MFRDRHYKDSHPIVADKIQAIEYATYLALDQFNGNGQDALDYLCSRNIPGIPVTIADIDFSSNYAHRTYTHRGWNVDYGAKSHWEERKQILINTVDKELFSSLDTPLEWFPWLNEIVYGKNDYQKQCESFCILLYYVHVLGDHIEAGEDKAIGQGETRPKTLEEKKKGLFYVAPLSNPHDSNNPGIIPDMITCLETLFPTETNSRAYKTLISQLQELSAKSAQIYGSKGGVDTEEEFDKYNACAVSLLETLANYVPDLLKKEVFFKNAFYIK